MTDAIQTIPGPNGMTSRINWTLLGWVMIQRAALLNNPDTSLQLRSTCPTT
jgi:hypothetical protein